MARARRVVWVIGLLVAVSARVTWAVPVLAVGELRAVTCCTKDCPGSRTPDRCCGYRQDAGDPATVGPQARATTFVPAAVLPASWSVSPLPGAAAGKGLRLPAPAPPSVLRTVVLRL